MGKPLSRTMLLVDSLSGRFTSIKLRAKVSFFSSAPCVENLITLAS